MKMVELFKSNSLTIIECSPKIKKEIPNQLTHTLPINTIPKLSYMLLAIYIVNNNPITKKNINSRIPSKFIL